MKVGKIKKWSNEVVSPFAWQRVLFRLLPEFQKEGLFLHQVTDETVLSESLLDKIGQAYEEIYSKNPIAVLE
jgi:hypothetical protein